MHDEAETSLSTTAEGDSPLSTRALLEDVPLPRQLTPLLPEMPVASQPQPTRLPLRFGTAMSPHSRQTFIIDISDDEEDEEEEESAQNAFNTGPNNSIESSDSPLLASTPIPESSPEQQQPSAAQSVGNIHSDISLSRPQLEHDVDPPFMTDGRGRVVWSSTRNAPGRGTAAEGRASRHSRAGSAPRIACPSPTTTRLVSNTRGYAWGGQDAQGMDGKVGGGEQSSDMA